MFLTDRNTGSVQKRANEILKLGGIAEMEVVDGLNEKAVNNHIESIVKKDGTVDISFYAIGANLVMNVSFVDILTDDFVSLLTMTLQTRFVTTNASAKIMMKQKSSVILTFTATGSYGSQTQIN